MNCPHCLNLMNKVTDTSSNVEFMCLKSNCLKNKTHHSYICCDTNNFSGDFDNNIVFYMLPFVYNEKGYWFVSSKKEDCTKLYLNGFLNKNIATLPYFTPYTVNYKNIGEKIIKMKGFA